MKIEYKGFELEAKREKCLAGYDLLYISVFRLLDGYEVLYEFEDFTEKVGNKISQLKDWVDRYLENVKNGVCPICEEPISETMNHNLYCGDCDEYYESN